MSQSKLLAASEVASQLAVSLRTVAYYCAAGVFPNAFRLGTSKTAAWRIPQSDVDAFIQQAKKRAQSSHKD